MCSGELCLDLIEKQRDDGLDKGTSKFDGIRLLDNDREDDIIMHLVKDTELRVVDMLQDRLIVLVEFGHLAVVSLYFMLDVKDLLVHVAFVGFAKG